jgi:glycosyltransferase involved in cell wall biosynthesis
VVGIVANINPIKGLEVFIKAAALINRQTTNVHFAVLGPIYENQKRYFNELELLCEKLSVSNIEFLGGRSDVRPLLKRFDIYVCSSLAESSPISVWEAMAMGTPVISTDVGDVPLYVRDEDNGFIVNVEDSEALAERLKLLISNSELRHQFGARGREVVVSELGLGRCAARHLNAYNNILE